MLIEKLLTSDSAPIIAILRGVQPSEVASIGRALIDGGVRMIEVPLNSPDALTSIEILVRQYANEAVLGAGTVTTRDAATRVQAAGGSIIVMPHTEPTLIRHIVALGMTPMAGFATPTEAFTAMAAGARHLKFFPAAALGTAHLRSIKEILPPEAAVWAVGGTHADNLQEWFDAGVIGVGVGTALFRPGDSAQSVEQKAAGMVRAWRGMRAPNAG